MMKWFVALVATTLAAPALAAGSQSDDLTWTLPTSRVDGAPLPVEEIAYTELELYKDGVVVASEAVPAPATSFTYNRPAPPNYEMCYRARVVDTDGQASDWTGQVCKTVKGRPNPPGQLDVK